MTASAVITFKKTAACPSDAILMSYRSKTLSSEIMMLVRYHLSTCEFCCAELPLLGHYTRPQRRERRAPEIPMNLRILAESLLAQKNAANRKKRKA